MARNKYPEETVEKILTAARRLFLEKGYEKTTIRDIVDQLGGLTKGAVYHHFKSKEEIMDAIRAIRARRAEMNVAPGRKVQLTTPSRRSGGGRTSPAWRK